MPPWSGNREAVCLRPLDCSRLDGLIIRNTTRAPKQDADRASWHGGAAPGKRAAACRLAFARSSSPTAARSRAACCGRCARWGSRASPSTPTPTSTRRTSRDADEAVRIGPPPSRESYLAIDRILAAARGDRRRRDPSRLRLPLRERRLRGARRRGRASSSSVRRSRRSAAWAARSARRRSWRRPGVPVVPGRVARRAAAQGERRARRATIGFPVLIKASAGGGGKGMRIVRDEAAFTEALATARREAESAFGDGTLLIERYFDAPRHIEIQIFGDTPRQRHPPRRARVLDPAPLSEDHRGGAVARGRRRRCARAWATRRSRRRARSATSAPAPSSSSSTQSGAFYFLEVNTRLQVEHPVTEAVTGLDLVRWQILLAQGEPLPLTQARGARSPAMRSRPGSTPRIPSARLPAGDRHASRLWEPRGARGRALRQRRRGRQRDRRPLRSAARQDHRARADARRGDRASRAARSRSSASARSSPIATSSLAVLDHPGVRRGRARTRTSSSSICRADARTPARRRRRATASTRSSPRSTSTSGAGGGRRSAARERPVGLAQQPLARAGRAYVIGGERVEVRYVAEPGRRLHDRGRRAASRACRVARRRRRARGRDRRRPPPLPRRRGRAASSWCTVRSARRR